MTGNTRSQYGSICKIALRNALCTRRITGGELDLVTHHAPSAQYLIRGLWRSATRWTRRVSQECSIVRLHTGGFTRSCAEQTGAASRANGLRVQDTTRSEPQLASSAMVQRNSSSYYFTPQYVSILTVSASGNGVRSRQRG